MPGRGLGECDGRKVRLVARDIALIAAGGQRVPPRRDRNGRDRAKAGRQMHRGGKGKGQPGGCPLCEGRAWRNARQDQLCWKGEISLQRYVKKTLMARCRPACPQGENGGPVEKMGLPGR